MLWEYVLTYLICTECSIIVALGFVLFHKDPPDFALIGNQKKPKTFGEVCWTIAKYLILAPVAAPYLAYRESRALDRAREKAAYWKKVGRTHYELVLEPLSRDEISTDVWDYLEEHSTSLVERGCLCLGDYRTKDGPLSGQVRYFLSSDRMSLVEVGQIREMQFFEYDSFLEHGTVAVSGNCDPIDFANELAERCYCIQSLPGTDVISLMDQHDEFLQGLSRRDSVGIRELDAETWQDYAHYSNRRFSEIKFETGRADAPPPPAEFPRWVPVAASV